MNTHNPFFRAGLILGLLLAGPVALWAQSPAAETLQQQVNVRTVEQAPAQALTSDADLGDIDVVQRIPKPDMFTFSTSQQYFYTDNVFYTHHDEQGASAYLGSYTGSIVPYSTRDWTPRINLQYNMVRYGAVPSADFDNENATVSSQYVFGGDRSWTWTASVNASRFTAPHGNDHSFYQEIVYDSQVSHAQQLLKDTPLFFIAAYDLAYHQANPDYFDRLDNTLSFSLAFYIVPELSVGPYVRPSSRTYWTDSSFQHDRYDFNLSAGLDVTWTPIKYLSVSADLSHTDDYSNNSAESYDQTSPGVSLTGSYKF